jgi:hypothetical protein
MPRRWLMPRQNPPTRLAAAPATPLISMTPLTREIVDVVGGGHRAQVRAGAAGGVHGLGVEQGGDPPQRGTVEPVGLAVDRDGARTRPVQLRVCTAVLSPVLSP